MSWVFKRKLILFDSLIFFCTALTLVLVIEISIWLQEKWHVETSNLYDKDA
jgi:hypothetical protein